MMSRVSNIIANRRVIQLAAFGGEMLAAQYRRRFISLISLTMTNYFTAIDMILFRVYWRRAGDISAPF